MPPVAARADAADEAQEPSPDAGTDAYLRWHSCGSRRRPYQWVAPKKAGGVFYCQGCQKPGRCVACADEQRRPLTAGTIPVLCRIHAGLLPDEPEAAIEVGLSWPSWQVFPLTPSLGVPAAPPTLLSTSPAQLALFA